METPRSIPVERTPTFSALTPHYSEKILLFLRGIIREEDKTTRVTLLEDLQQLHPFERANFRQERQDSRRGSQCAPAPVPSPKAWIISLHPSGRMTFRSTPSRLQSNTLRARIWPSLRAQTLYRTVSGFMNYAKAIKLLYRVENPELLVSYGRNAEPLERDLERMAQRKFKFVVSIPRYSKFNREEPGNVEFLLRAYPDLQTAYPMRNPHADLVANLACALRLSTDVLNSIPTLANGSPSSTSNRSATLLGDGESDN